MRVGASLSKDTPLEELVALAFLIFVPIRFQCLAIVAGLSIAIASPTCAAVTLLHKFASGANDGGQPFEGPIIQGSTLYGTTYEGGDTNNGILYKVNTNGSGYQVLHEFAGGVNDGAGGGVLAISGSTLYGATGGGGDLDAGTLYKINTDGTGYQLLHEFAAGAIDGGSPGGLTLIGSTLYGTSYGAETGNKGTVFKINANGTGYQVLHSFVGGVDDGRAPSGPVTAIGSTLYGLTLGGGDSNAGTLYKVNTDGTGFQLLYEFSGGVNGIDYPGYNLTLIGSTFYAVSSYGGTFGRGTLFKINTNGTGFQFLHHFAGGANDGDIPSGGLALVNSKLYGMTAYGGDNSRGTIYELNTDGTGFTLRQEFAGGANDGQGPQGTLVGTAPTFYGVTSDGALGPGVVFSFSLVVPGDYSGNGSVGAEDYTVWRNNFGSTSQLAADGNGNGAVDSADYVVWRKNRTSGSGTTSTPAIPEPATMLLVISAALSWVQHTRSATSSKRSVE